MDRYSSNKKPIQEDNAPTAGFIELCMNALKHNNLPYVQELATSASFVLSSKLFGNKAMAIHVAAEHGSLNVLAYLLQQFPGQLDETDEFGKTPVFWNGKKTMVDLKPGESRNLKEADFMTARK